MTWAWHAGTRRENGAFEKARVREQLQLDTMRGQAARTVARQAADVDDCRRLLSMLGLDDRPSRGPADDHELRRRDDRLTHLRGWPSGTSSLF